MSLKKLYCTEYNPRSMHTEKLPANCNRDLIVQYCPVHVHCTKFLITKFLITRFLSSEVPIALKFLTHKIPNTKFLIIKNS